MFTIARQLRGLAWLLLGCAHLFALPSLAHAQSLTEEVASWETSFDRAVSLGEMTPDLTMSTFSNLVWEPLVPVFVVEPISTSIEGTTVRAVDSPPSSRWLKIDLDISPRWDRSDDFVTAIVEDQRRFYSPRSLAKLGVLFAAGGAMANTHFDVGTLDPLEENLVNTPSDEYAQFLHGHHFLGNGFFLLPVYAGIAVVGKGLGPEPSMPVVGQWGEETTRSIAVGFIPLLAAQSLTGGSRPGETGHASQWRPLKDDNGVSGHAFMGAVPLMTAAKMTDRIWLKGVFYSASILPGLSRITDGAHYPSQVFLGWGLAYIATSAVHRSDDDAIQVGPWADGQNSGLSLSKSW